MNTDRREARRLLENGREILREILTGRVSVELIDMARSHARGQLAAILTTLEKRRGFPECDDRTALIIAASAVRTALAHFDASRLAQAAAAIDAGLARLST